ncbi:MAG: flagellar protein FliS [Planctomycetota bacterium]|jgi:flagellar protein FliS
MHNAAETYRQNAVESAPPIKIIRMLFEGAVRFLGQAETFDASTETVQFNDRIRRAEAIVSELRLSLDNTQNPALCEELERLYLFVEDELREAFLQHDKTRVANAKGILETLSDAWNRVKPEPAGNVLIEKKKAA